MAKKFTITGTCIPDRHYMADTSGKLAKVMAMVEAGEYFIINRPRQFGKTTTMFQLVNTIRKSERFVVFSISFGGVGDVVFKDELHFSRMFFGELVKDAKFFEPGLVPFLTAQSKSINGLDDLSQAISGLVEKTSKKAVLLIDEVDKSSNNQLYISFLAMLRDKYLAALQMKDTTFHSIVLAGVHDVKSLKLKLRPGDEEKLNSPWNIAADFKVAMELQPNEIVPMLQDFQQETGVEMDAQLMADQLFYYTSGYPFLVSKLCKMLAEDGLAKDPAKWTAADLESAVNWLVRESNANFDSLVKNLENNQELYDLVYAVLIQGEQMSLNIHDPIINLGVTYGIFPNPFQHRNGLVIHNRIYAEVIANYMASKTLRKQMSIPKYVATPFLLPGNRLDMEKVLLKFQEFMKEQYSRKDRDFLERHGRMVFLAYLKPILNGAGYDFKEPHISEEKRLDVAITFYQHKYIAELKIWRGAEAHGRGLKQLAEYLEAQHLSEGYLLIFDHSATKSWKQERLVVEGKKVFAVWV